MTRSVVEAISMTPEEAERLRELETQHAVHETECAAQHKAFALRMGKVEALLWWLIYGWGVMMVVILGKDTKLGLEILGVFLK